jgi:hypothetical protein
MKKLSGMFKSENKYLLEKLENKLIKRGILVIIRAKNKQYILYC